MHTGHTFTNQNKPDRLSGVKNVSINPKRVGFISSLIKREKDT